MRKLYCYLLGFLLLACASNGWAQTINVRDGATLHLNDASVSTRCADMVVNGALILETGVLSGVRDLTGAGILLGGAGVVRISGDFDIEDYLAELSHLHINDQCQSGAARVVGAREFHHFSANTSTGRTLIFDAGTTQRFASSLSLSGSDGQRLFLRTTVPGSAVFFDLANGASQSHAWINVADNHAVGVSLAPGPPSRYNAVDSGNLTRWFQLEIFRDRFETSP